MSAPNKTYDPVEVAALAPDGGRSASPPRRWPPSPRRGHPGRAEGGPAGPRRRPGADRAGQRRDRRAAAGRQGRGGQAGRRGPGRDPGGAGRPAGASWRPSGTPRVLIDEAVDVTLPWDRQPRRRPAPGHDHGRAAGRRVRRHGLRDRRGTRGRGRVVQLRRAQLPARPPGPRDAGHALRGRPGRCERSGRGAAHAHLAGADPGHAEPAAAAVRGQPRQVLPQRRARRDAQPGVPPDRVPGRGRGPDHGRPARRDPRVRGRHVRRGPADPAAAGLLPVHRAVGGRVDGMPRLPRRVGRAGRRALPGVPLAGLDRDRRLRHGQPAGAGRLRHRPGPVHRASRSGWASSGP